MKKLLLILLCLPMIGFGQGSIISLTVFPTYPTETDTVYIYAELLFTSSDCSLDMKSHSVLGNNIVASTQHCLGMLTAMCNTTDTFKLNPLAVGTYTFDLTIFTGFGGPPCMSLPGEAYETITFYISSSTSVEEHTTNKELLKVTDLLGRESKQTNQSLFYIYDDGTVEKKIIIE